MEDSKSYTVLCIINFNGRLMEIILMENISPLTFDKTYFFYVFLSR